MGPLFYTLHMRCLKALLALPSKYTITVSTIAASVQGTISPNHSALPAHKGALIFINQTKAMS